MRGAWPDPWLGCKWLFVQIFVCAVKKIILASLSLPDLKLVWYVDSMFQRKFHNSQWKTLSFQTYSFSPFFIIKRNASQADDVDRSPFLFLFLTANKVTYDDLFYHNSLSALQELSSEAAGSLVNTTVYI